MRPQGTKLPNATCAHCGTAFYRKPSNLAGRTEHYCSKRCAVHARKPQSGKQHEPNAVCAQCGTAFYRKPYRLAATAPHYCSLACRRLADRKPNTTCAWCGTAFYRKPSLLAGRTEHYCSNRCTAQAYGQRRRTQQEPNTACGHCGTPLYRFPHQLARAAVQYCSRACQWRAQGAAHRGARSSNWKGGRYVDKRGYVWITLPDVGTVQEHRYIMEQHLGRPLHRSEEVHHEDRNRQNNHISNLTLQPSKSAHSKLHNPPLRTWAKNHERCVACGTTQRRHVGHGLCQACYSRRQRARQPQPRLDVRRGVRWAVEHERCRACGTTERRHQGRGLCVLCFGRACKAARR